jgi:hypothetical protein
LCFMIGSTWSMTLLFVLPHTAGAWQEQATSLIIDWDGASQTFSQAGLELWSSQSPPPK